MKHYSRILPTILLLLPAWTGAQKLPISLPGTDKITKIISDCQSKTSAFQSAVKLKPRSDAPNLQKDADNLQNSMKQVGDAWKGGHDIQQTRTSVTSALSSSQKINNFMKSYKGDTGLTNSWAGVQTPMTALAKQFGLPALK